MIISDILLQNEVNNTIICNSLEKIFKIKPDDVCLVENLEDMPEKNRFKIVCVKNTFEEGLPILLNIYGFENQYDQDILIELFLNLASILEFSCFLPHDDDNPFALLQLNPDESIEKVYYNSDIFEEKEIYVLI